MTADVEVAVLLLSYLYLRYLAFTGQRAKVTIQTQRAVEAAVWVTRFPRLGHRRLLSGHTESVWSVSITLYLRASSGAPVAESDVWSPRAEAELSRAQGLSWKVWHKRG